jgi:hypothetical protein
MVELPKLASWHYGTSRMQPTWRNFCKERPSGVSKTVWRRKRTRHEETPTGSAHHRQPPSRMGLSNWTDKISTGTQDRDCEPVCLTCIKLRAARIGFNFQSISEQVNHHSTRFNQSPYAICSQSMVVKNSTHSIHSCQWFYWGEEGKM